MVFCVGSLSSGLEIITERVLNQVTRGRFGLRNRSFHRIQVVDLGWFQDNAAYTWRRSRDWRVTFLIQQGFIMRTPRGRQVTELAYKHLGKIPESGQKGLF